MADGPQPPTHTDQYLNFTSHHPLVHKRSVVRTLTNRAKLYVITPDDQQAEIDHVRNAFRANNIEEWALNVPLSKSHKVDKNENKNTNSRRLMLGLPYVQGTSEILARIFKSHGVNMYHKPTIPWGPCLFIPRIRPWRKNNVALSITSPAIMIPNTRM